MRAFEAELVYGGAGAAAAEVATLPGAAAAAAEAGTTTTAPARGGGRAAAAPTQASPARWPQQALVPAVLVVVILARCRKQGRRGAVAVAAERAAPTKSR